MKLWHSYALSNYSVAKVWIEALFPPIKPNITRVDLNLTTEWRRLDRHVWGLGATINNTWATQQRFHWLMKQINATIDNTRAANRTWTREIGLLHSDVLTFLASTLVDTYAGDEARVRFAMDTLRRDFFAGKGHQEDRLLSFEAQTDQHIAYLYRQMAIIRGIRISHDGLINASVASHRAWNGELFHKLYALEEGDEAVMHKQLKQLNESIDVFESDYAFNLSENQVCVCICACVGARKQW